MCSQVLINIYSVSTGSANVYMSKADEVERDIRAPSHQYPMYLSSDEAQATTALPLTLIGNGNVGLVYATPSLQD